MKRSHFLLDCHWRRVDNFCTWFVLHIISRQNKTYRIFETSHNHKNQSRHFQGWISLSDDTDRSLLIFFVFSLKILFIFFSLKKFSLKFTDLVTTASFTMKSVWRHCVRWVFTTVPGSVDKCLTCDTYTTIFNTSKHFIRFAHRFRRRLDIPPIAPRLCNVTIMNTHTNTFFFDISMFFILIQFSDIYIYIFWSARHTVLFSMNLATAHILGYAGISTPEVNAGDLSIYFTIREIDHR